MKQKTITNLFGIVGILLWVLTLLLRETLARPIMEPLNFILGVLPNIGAVWVCLAIVEGFLNYRQKIYDFRIALISTVAIFILALIS